MKHPEVAKLLSRLYFDENAAQAFLIHVGMPVYLIPKFFNPLDFWTVTVAHLENGLGIVDGVRSVIAAAAGMFPGNPEIQQMHAKWSGVAQQPEVVVPGRPISPEGPCPTLTLVGVDLPNEFLDVIRQQLGPNAGDLLYVSKEQCAVAIPDPGDGAPRLREQIQELLQTYAPNAKIQVVYEKYKFRPYLYSDLTVFGPDTTPYRLQGVPATMTPADIAAAIVEETRSAMTDKRGGTVSTVIDHETENGPERLDPEKTLHENKVKDKGKLRVGTKAIAGNISPELRLESQLRMRAQIRRYALGHPAFEIVDYDNEDLPNRLAIELNGPGLAPPENLGEFLAGTDNLNLDDFRDLPWDELRPTRIDFHRFTIHLTPMFPVVAPYVVWNTPVFHPNIWREQSPGVRAGTVCLGPLMGGYRPDLDFGYLSQLLTDIGTYRNYDVVDATTFPDPPAAFWARTRPGQEVIQSLGGPPMREATERESEKRLIPSVWLRPLSDAIDEL